MDPVGNSHQDAREFETSVNTHQSSAAIFSRHGGALVTVPKGTAIQIDIGEMSVQLWPTEGRACVGV